jgi:hypothetical protein
MGEFTHDTSGAVEIPNSGGQVRRGWLWSDLSPFEQGYVEGMLGELDRSKVCWTDGIGHVSPQFSDLAPETLEAIRKDCAAYTRFDPFGLDYPKDGARFYHLRQTGHFPSYPPLTVSLGGDGKVRLLSDKPHQGSAA